ncbi:RagB/SusD family nutrient uptake outer membrane protein [Chitinophaga sp. RAB17]|uniref:RagB/SusD family nutrient uptake outer membrane protein n=1 Tax=Chitinophaga sp. RAB17 TaxID=3233049 RepID=UPI003F90626E
MNKLIVYRAGIARLVVLIFLWGSLPGCSKTLEQQPKSYFSTENFFSTVDEATMAVLGVYEMMANYNTYGFQVSMLYDMDCDISQVSGTTLVDFRAVAHYAVTPQHNYITGTWQYFYKGIDRANLVIQKIPEMSLSKSGTEAQKAELNRLLGEARFLRGFYYFELVRLYGDVPMKLGPTQSGEELQLPRTNRDTVYAQVIRDMTAAIDLLPPTKTTVDERVSRNGVRGMLARVALFSGGYSLRQNGKMERPANYKDFYVLAQKQTAEIMASGKNALNPGYEQYFRNQCKLVADPQETMFEVALYSVNGTGSTAGMIGTWNSPASDAGNQYGRANGYIKTTPLFRNSFKTGDLRKDVATVTYRLDASGAKVEYTGKNDWQWTPGKWRRDWQNLPPKDLNNTDVNWVILRYADVLLMRAEAENELNDGPNADAYNAINMVRRRAYGKPINTADASVDLPQGLSKADFFDRLKDERAWELCFEGTRRADLIRWNLLGSSLKATQDALTAYRAGYPYIAGTQFVPNKHELYPIPLRDMDLNPKLVQNPQY